VAGILSIIGMCCLVLLVAFILVGDRTICFFKGHDLRDYRITINGKGEYWWIATCARCREGIYLKTYVDGEYNPNHDAVNEKTRDERSRSFLGVR
jgi:hypothetical protein